jgi:DNA-binding GntR family transcriptional regulator
MADVDEVPSAAERAYRILRDGILDGSLESGRMLGEASLAASLEMSRTPVRAALTRLQDEGWIVIYPKRGALVQGLTERTIAELADVRFLLETTAVRGAPEELRQSLARVLERSLEEQRAAFERGDVRRFIDLTLQFHRGFVEAGGNGVLVELYDRLSDRQRYVLFASGSRLLARCADIIAEHELLTQHLRAGRVSEFADVLRTHIAEVGSDRAGALVGGDSLPATRAHS